MFVYNSFNCIFANLSYLNIGFPVNFHHFVIQFCKFERLLRPPPQKKKKKKNWINYDFYQTFIRMLKNKAQEIRKSIKTTIELPGHLSGPWTLANSEFGSALVMCVRAHNLLRPPPPPK